MLARIALDGSWENSILWEETNMMWRNHTITEAIIRVALLSIPANFVEHKDQRNQGPSVFCELLVLKSTELQADGITKDLEIEHIPVE
jgi:hypothetical protein